MARPRALETCARKGCNNTFESRRVDRRFCSTACRLETWKRLGSNRAPEKPVGAGTLRPARGVAGSVPNGTFSPTKSIGYKGHAGPSNWPIDLLCGQAFGHGRRRVDRELAQRILKLELR
jgi:hypothetical protein